MSVDFLLSRLDELEPFPNTGMVLIKNTSPASFVIPFHPKFCFGLVPIGDFDKTPQGLDLATMVLNNPRDVEMINNLSIGTELANQQLIVGSDPKELERLYSFYQELLKNKAK
jgi:hypothetical protein